MKTLIPKEKWQRLPKNDKVKLLEIITSKELTIQGAILIEEVDDGENTQYAFIVKAYTMRNGFDLQNIEKHVETYAKNNTINFYIVNVWDL